MTTPIDVFAPFVSALCAFEALRIVLDEEDLTEIEREALTRAVRAAVQVKIARDRQGLARNGLAGAEALHRPWS